MRQSPFDFVGNLDTLLAVIVGALLATIGGLIGEHFEDRIERKRRERDAARFFSEILATIDELVDRGMTSQRIGDPWGPVTMRLFRTALREAEVYERNRERLFDLHDEGLRKKIHTHVISEILPLEAMIDATERIEKLGEILEERGDLSPERRDKLARLSAEAIEMRGAGLEFIKAERANTADLCSALARLSAIKPPSADAGAAGGVAPS